VRDTAHCRGDGCTRTKTPTRRYGCARAATSTKGQWGRGRAYTQKIAIVGQSLADVRITPESGRIADIRWGLKRARCRQAAGLPLCAMCQRRNTRRLLASADFAVLDVVPRCELALGAHNNCSVEEMGHAVGSRSRPGDINQQD
jgi:hypothetical protein